MKLLQLYYTSCQKGISAGAGFQTLAMSAGITEEERREIERIGVYIPALDLPGQPTAEEIERLFPVAFSFFRLSSGRYGVCQSKYTGRDYSGRFGNYFCHALVLESGQWPLYPIELFNSAIFKDSLESVGSIDSSNARNLTPLMLDRTIAGPTVTFETIADFLAEEDRLQQFNVLLQAMLNHGTDGRRIVLCDDHPNIPLWFGALQFSLPVKLAHHITFTTYTHDPEVAGMVLTSTAREGSRFGFTKIQTDFQYYIFDWAGSGASSAVEGKTKLNMLAATAFEMESQQILSDFHDFIEEFSYDAVNGELDKAVLLYALVWMKNKVLDNEELCRAIDFASHCNTVSTGSKIMEKLTEEHQGHSKLAWMSDNLEIETASKVVPFFLQAAAQSNSLQYKQAVLELFLMTFCNYISEGIPQEALDSYYQTGKSAARLQGWEMPRLLQEPKWIAEFAGRFNDSEPVEHSAYVYQLLITEWAANGVAWNSLPQEAAAFLNNRLQFLVRRKWDFTACFLSLTKARDSNYLEQVLIAGGNAADTETLLQKFLGALTTALQQLPAGEAGLIRERLHSMPFGSGAKLLYKEFTFRLASEPDMRQPFWDYYTAAGKCFTGIAAGYLCEAVSLYVTALEKRQASYLFADCIKLLQDENLRHNLTAVQCERLILAFEKRALDTKNPQELRETLYRVHRLKEEFRIVTKPDMAFLLLAPQWPKEDLSLGKPTEDQFDGMDEASFFKYLTWSLPLFLEKYRTVDEQFDIFDGLSIKNREELVLKKYYEAVIEIYEGEAKDRVKVFAHFLAVFLGFAVKPGYVAQRVIVAQLVETLVGDKELPVKVEKELNLLRPNYEHKQFAAIMDLWNQLLTKVEERRSKTLMGRLKGFFSRGSKQNERGDA